MPLAAPGLNAAHGSEQALLLHVQDRYQRDYDRAPRRTERHRDRPRRNRGRDALSIGAGIIVPLALDAIRRERERRDYEEDYDRPPRRRVRERNTRRERTRTVRRRPTIRYVVFPDVVPLPPFRPLDGVAGPAGDVPVTPAILPNDQDEQRWPEQIVVQFGPGANQTAPEDIAVDFNLLLVRQSELALIDRRIVVYSIPDGRDAEDVEDQVEADARTLAAQGNFIYRLSEAERPLNAVAQYALQSMKVWKAFPVTRGAGVKIAVIDSRIDTTHPEFADTIRTQFDATGRDVAEADKHGTAVAGIIGARGDSLGVAPASEILAVNAFWREGPDAGQTSSSEVIARAVDWAVANEAQVLNLSFAGPEDPLIAEMLEAAHGRGVLAIAAAGNNGKDAEPAYPAALEHVIAATATDSSSALFTHSNRGDYVDIAAPGVDIFSPAPDKGYQMISGTSMASAHVSGLIALVVAARGAVPEFADTLKLLSETAIDLGEEGPDPEFGAGLADAEQAVGKSASLRQASAEQ